MKTIPLSNSFTDVNQVRALIENLYLNKDWNLNPKYFKTTDRSFGKGIYFTSKIKSQFTAYFTSKELCPELTLSDDFHNEIALVRKIKLPPGDTPNGFSAIEQESYKRLHPNHIEVEEYFRFGLIHTATNTPSFHSCTQKGCPNYIFKELSTSTEHFVTFESLIEKEMKRKIQESFEAIANFYYVLNMRHPNYQLDFFDR